MRGSWGSHGYAGGTTRLLGRAWLPLGIMFGLCILAIYVSLPDLPAVSPSDFWSAERSTVFSLDGRVGEVSIEQLSDGSFSESRRAIGLGVSGHHSMLEKLHSSHKVQVKNASAVDENVHSQLVEEPNHSRPDQRDPKSRRGGRKEGPGLDSWSADFSKDLLSALSPDYLAQMQRSYSSANGSKLLILNAQHGLGNRLRALASGQAVAAASGRHFRLVWIPDLHCGARFQELFDSPNLDVWDMLDEREVNGPNFERYNYMENEEGGRKDQIVVTKSERHVHVKSAYRLRSDQRVITEDLRSALKSLRPSKLVQRHITKTQRTLDKLRPRGLRQVRVSRSQLQPVKQTRASYIGVHIRSNQPDKEPALTLPESAYTPEGWATIKQMRSLTRLELFIGEIKRLVEVDPSLRIYLAADNADAYVKFQHAIGRDRVTWLEKHGCLDRRSECQQLALADMYILSHSSQILGSLWSSFTEVAGLLNDVPVRIAGRDFFLPPPPRHAPVLCNPSSMDHPARFHGASLFTAVMGRQDALAKVLPSWLNVRGIDEVVIVDWGSDVPLRPFVESFQDGRIKLIEVSDERLWVLSRAMNLAARHTAGNRLLKVDSDTFLEEDFLEAHPLNETGKAFWAGNWKRARTQNEKHLNGVVYLPRREWILVNGYDECVVSYGWEDEDLYRRLAMHGNLRQDFDFSKLRHVEHGDAQRIAKQQLGGAGGAPPWQTHMNIIMIKILSGMLTPWNQGAEGARYNCSQEKTWVCECSIYSVPPQLEDLVPAHRLQLARLAALAGELRSATGAAFDAPTLASVKSEDWLSKQLEMHYRAETRRPVIVAQLLGCCSARLEALVLARRLAVRWSRPLRIVWQPLERDGCVSRFWDLFTPGPPPEKPSPTAVRRNLAGSTTSGTGTDREGNVRSAGSTGSGGTSVDKARGAGSAQVTGIGSESGSKKRSRDAESGEGGPEIGAQFDLAGVAAEIAEEFYHWEVTNSLYDVYDTVTSPGVRLPERAPGQKHVFLRLRLAEGAREPAIGMELIGTETETETERTGEGLRSRSGKEAPRESDELSSRLAELGIELKEGVLRSPLTKGGVRSLLESDDPEAASSMGGFGSDAEETTTSAACQNPGALLVRLGGSPVHRLLALSSAHTFAAALGRRLVAWWPDDVASAGLTFADLFPESEVEVRTGSGPDFANVSSVGEVRQRRRALLEEGLEERGGGAGSEVGHESVGKHHRKQKMLAELLHRVEARKALQRKDGVMEGARRGQGVEGAISRAVSREQESAPRDGPGAERVETLEESVGLSDGGLGGDKAAGREIGAVETGTVNSRREMIGAEIGTPPGASSDVPSAEVLAESTAAGDQRLPRMEPVGMLDLDKTGDALPVVEPLPSGGLAWYAWDPPAWDVGAPVVPLADVVGKHMLLNLNGTLPALGDHFVMGGVPGWKHRALEPSQRLAEALAEARKNVVVADGQGGVSADLGQSPSSQIGEDAADKRETQVTEVQVSVVLIVDGASLGGCASLDAALNQVLLMLPNQNDPQSKARLLERLRVVIRGSNATIMLDNAPQIQVGLGTSGEDGAAGNVGSRNSSICLEAFELARSLVKSTHSGGKQAGPLCMVMHDCTPLHTPTDSPSEQGRGQLSDALLRSSSVDSKISASALRAHEECLLQELADILLVSEKSEQIFSFDGYVAIDLAVAWGPGSRGYHRIACPKTP